MARVTALAGGTNLCGSADGGGLPTLSYLLHVGAPDQLGTEVEVLPVGLVQINRQVVVGLLQIALVRVEHNCLKIVDMAIAVLANSDCTFVRCAT